MVVDVKEDGSSFTASSPRALFDMRVATIAFNPSSISTYEVARDGQRFLMNTQIEESSPSPLTVVLNWTGAFKR
jgi:hypothetical protein